MIQLTPTQIKEIAEQLDCGFRCYIHKQTGELITIPDENSHPDMDLEGWEEDIEKIETNFTEYIVIDPLESRDSFGIMEDFVESLPESEKIREWLINALNQHKPFSKFKFVIDNSGEYRQQWFDFKAKRLQEYVQEEIEFLARLKK
jgi:hypothetical protein